MKKKQIFVLIFTFAIVLCSYVAGHIHVKRYRSSYSYSIHVASLPVSNDIMEMIAGEFKGLFADYLVLEAANFIGNEFSSNADHEEWMKVARLLEQSSSLDPYFQQTYRLAQGTLPWSANLIEETLTILNRSKTHRIWDWQPGFFIGFDYHFFLKDNLSASKELMEASTRTIPPQSISLATWASRLSSKAGQTRTAIDFLLPLYEENNDERVKKMLRERIQALKGVEILQEAVDRFKDEFGRVPITLNELLDKSILFILPVNPYGHPFILNDGNVDF